MGKPALSVNSFVYQFALKFFRRFRGINLTKRATALFLTIALLAPLFLFNPVWETSARSGHLLTHTSAPLSAPPQAYAFPNSGLTTDLKIISTVSSMSESVLRFFTVPPVPEGFEIAKPVSPVSAFASSMAVFFSFGAKKTESVSAPAPLPLPAGTVSFDFDADGKADFSRWRASNGGWSVKKSSDNSIATYTLGSSSSIIVPADYDSDGKADYAVFNPSTGGWTIRKSSTNTDQTLSGFGQSGDKPVVGDYDGDTKADPAVWRPSNGTWYVAQSSNSYTVVSAQFGQSGDIPVAGDYDGDGALDKAVFRPTGGYWYVLGTTSGFISAQWGLSTDIPVPADYDGDSKTDYSVYRGSTGTWYAYKSSGTSQYISQTWGNYGDQPVPADYDGDGQADFAVWRPKTGNWHVYKSCNYNGTCSQGNLYKYAQHGANGDVPAPASYLKQIGSLVQGYELNTARLSPKNSTGGTDLYSRNFSWGTSLVGLPGRAGLSAGFGMSYNSLVWTKQGTNIYFDADAGNISPGFRFGFPVIDPAYFDDEKDTFNYLMVSPSGARVEFRQLSGASDTYETADSSYVQLKTVGATNPNDPAENITITVTGTDGTRMSYEWKAGAFRCSKIKDRNGNYITVNHDEYGVLRTVTDTLGRVITVNYDNEFYPTSITQMWKDNNGAGSNVTHTWATFTYTTQEINTNFSSTSISNVYGPPNGTVLKVLQKITFPTETNLAGQHTVFSYNTWGQVKQITNYSADDTQLNYVKVNLPADQTNSQTDCPRFTETRSWVKNFNLQNNAEQEVVINNSIDESQTYSLPGSISGTATLIKVWMTGHPGNLITKTYLGVSGWKESLPIATEDCISTNCSGSDRKRWTWADWTQDDTNLNYTLNPRVKEARVGDTTNVKKTTIDYRLLPSSTVSEYGLVERVKIFAADLSTILKKVETDYNLDSAYTSRRIIGLPSKTELYGVNQSNNQLELVSKMTFAYDEGNFNDGNLEQNISNVIYHDNTNYSSSFVIGRGNMTSTKRWNVEYPTTDSYAVTSSVKYNIAGAPVAQISPWNGVNTRQVKISYADSFNDTTTSRNTYAYPTTVTDPENYSSTARYRVDIGANVWAKSPDLNSTTQGKVTARIYDLAGRLQRESVFKGNQAYLNNQEHAYTRYEYPSSQIQSKVYSTIVDTDTDGADADDEVLSEVWTDGAGRIRKSRSEHPGSIGGYTGTQTEYDILGQVKRSSVPTEINSSWTPSGDDASRGWLWNSQEYDWKGRTTRVIPSDSSGSDGKDQLFSYEGCGCAGGEQVTVQGEEVPVPGQSYNARRKQKIYSDILGRQYKTEIMNWDGTTVYSTSVNTFNGRDQILRTRLYAGTTSSSTYQDRTAVYDGHGRIWKTHRPEQRNSDNTPAYTTISYNADDSVQSVTDAREVVTAYGYNNRGQVNSITYGVPEASTIPVSADVSFNYDGVGNRIYMEDALGSITYEYDELSQMTAETRQFTDNLPNAPLPNNRFKLEYGYTLSGGLKFYKNPFGEQINYSHDKIGRLNAVTGSSFGGVTNYAANPQYRAWGALKHLEYGNGTKFDITNFNNKLQATNFEMKDANNTSFIKKQYQFYNDGSLKYMQDELDARFDRSYKYDQMSRMVEARTGAEARGQTGNVTDIPYFQNYSYNVFGNTIQTEARNYSAPSQTTINPYQNNRIIYGSGVGSYDAEGYPLYTEPFGTNAFNSAGQLDNIDSDCGEECVLKSRSFRYDGNNQLVKKWSVEHLPDGSPLQQTFYYIRSTVLGGEVISEFGSGGTESYVRAHGTLIAAQWQFQTDEVVTWRHKDLSLSTLRSTGANGQVHTNQDASENGRLELDPLGNNVGLEDWWYQNSQGTPDPTVGGDFPGFTSITNGQLIRYTVDGIQVPADYFGRMTDFAFGSSFGLIERQARLSAMPSGYKRDVFALVRQSPNSAPVFRPPGSPASNLPTLSDGETEIYGYLTVTSPVYNSNWAINMSLLRQTYRLIKIGGYNVKVTNYSYINELDKIFRDRLKNSKCRNAMDALAKKLGYKKGIEALFDQIKKNNNLLESIDKFEAVFPTTSEYHGASAINVPSDAAIVFNNRNYSPENMANLESRDIVDLFHELLHQAGKGADHTKIARAMFKLSSKMGDTITVTKENAALNSGNKTTFTEPATQKTGGIFMDSINSSYVNKWINTYCPK